MPSPNAGPFNLQTLTDALSLRAVGVPKLQAAEALNSSDKSFTVPTDVTWEVQSVWVELASTATVGNRQVVVQLQDSAADVIAEVRAGVVQAASLTRKYLFAPNAVDLSALRDSDYLSVAMPRWLLPEAFVIRVFDNAAVDAAADDMVVQMVVTERTEI